MERPASQWDASAAYHFLTSAVAPRPIAWVTTLDPATGVVNAAPFSWFQAVCADPMMLMLAINARRDGSPKDTVRNARASGELVVNVVTRDLVAPMVQSSAEYPPEVSEVQALGLATAPSRAVAAPRLRGCPVHFECRLEREVPLGRRKDLSLLLAEVVHVGADDAALDARGNLDPAKAVLVARMGGQRYVDTSASFEVERPRNDALRG